MHPFRFYRTSTSAIETPEKKNYIIVSLSGLLLFAHILNRCLLCCVYVCQSKKVHKLSNFFFSFFSFFFAVKVLMPLCWRTACVDIGKASCIYQAAEKHE